MEYNRFKTIITDIQLVSQRSTALYNLGLDLINFEDTYYKIFDHFFIEIFTKEQMEWINWYMWESDFGEKEDFNAFDNEGNIICNNVENLYKWITSL